MDDFRKVLKSEGLSKLGSDSISNYQLAWGKWDRWCYEWEIDPYKSTVNEVLNFLAFLFEKGYDYSWINGHKLAISTYHVQINNNPIEKDRYDYSWINGHKLAISTYHIQINNNPIGKDSRVCAYLIRDLLNQGLLLSGISNELRDNLNLPVKLLSQKLALLLALTAAARSSKIGYLNIEYMVKLGHKYIFTFPN